MSKKSLSNIEWIFFDVGGVLVDELAITRRRQEEEARVLQAMGVAATITDIQKRWQEASGIIGSIDLNIFKLFLNDDKLAVQANDRLKECLGPQPTYIDLAIPRVDAVSVLAELSKRYALGLIANQSPEIRVKLEAAGLLKFFDNQTVSNEHGFHKPDPQIFKAVFKETGADPKKSLMVDDNIERGLIPGKMFGMTTVWYKTEDRDVPDGVVDFTIESFRDLLSIFE